MGGIFKFFNTKNNTPMLFKWQIFTPPPPPPTKLGKFRQIVQIAPAASLCAVRGFFISTDKEHGMNHKKRIPPYAGMALICALALLGACGNPTGGEPSVPVTAISLDKGSLNLTPTGTNTLTVTYSPANTTETGVVWASSNIAVATVVDGTVTAIAVGTATITATSTANSSKTATCAVTVTDPIPLTGITLNRASVNLTPNGTTTLTVTYDPANTTESGVAWTSSNANVATVVDGAVTAVAVGTATITATSTAHSDMTATCAVTVTAAPIPLIGIALDRASVKLIPNRTTTLTVTYDPINTTESGVNWTSSNANVATVVGGTVTAVAVGTATITATSTAHNDMTTTCAVTVTAAPIPLIGISLTPNPLAITGIGNTGSFTVTYDPATTTETGVTWESSNIDVATVVDGVVTAVAVGNATITATSATNSNITTTCAVTITAAPIPLIGISLDKAGMDLNPNDKATLTVTYDPSDATEKGVVWKSDDTAVATVVNGVITAVAAGNTTITATSATNSSINATCSVSVTAASISLVGISLTPDSLAITGIGNTDSFTVTYNPADTTETGVTWTSSDNLVATVDSTTGVVIAVVVGEATITATSKANPSISASCTITVQPSFEGAGVNIVFEGPEAETIVLDDPVREGDMLTVTAPAGYDRYLWYLDYDSYGSTTDPTASVPVWFITPGLHYLTVIVEKDGNHFSKTLAYRVGY
jgi:uncharacterized protein YjdB